MAPAKVTLPSVLVYNVNGLYDCWAQFVEKLLTDVDYRNAQCIVITETKIYSSDSKPLTAPTDAQRREWTEQMKDYYDSNRDRQPWYDCLTGLFDKMGFYTPRCDQVPYRVPSGGVMWLVRLSWSAQVERIQQMGYRWKNLDANAEAGSNKHMEIVKVECQLGNNEQIVLIGVYVTLYAWTESSVLTDGKSKLCHFIADVVKEYDQRNAKPVSIIVAGDFNGVKLSYAGGQAFYPYIPDDVITCKPKSSMSSPDNCYSNIRNAYEYPESTRLAPLGHVENDHRPILLVPEQVSIKEELERIQTVMRDNKGKPATGFKIALWSFIKKLNKLESPSGEAVNKVVQIVSDGLRNNLPEIDAHGRMVEEDDQGNILSALKNVVDAASTLRDKQDNSQEQSELLDSLCSTIQGNYIQRIKNAFKTVREIIEEVGGNSSWTYTTGYKNGTMEPAVVEHY